MKIEDERRQYLLGRFIAKLLGLKQPSVKTKLLCSTMLTK